jgi:hypothetical protein
MIELRLADALGAQGLGMLAMLVAAGALAVVVEGVLWLVWCITECRRDPSGDPVVQR